MRGRCGIPSSLLILVFATLSAAGGPHKHVLLLHSFGQGFEPFTSFTEAFRRELGQQLGEPVEFFDVTLDSERFEGEASERPLMDYLTALFAGQQLDLVVPIGGAAARFGQKHRQQLFPTTPMLFACTDRRHLQPAAFATNDAVVAVANDPARMVEAILQVLPETTNIAVVIGNSPLEQFWLGEMRRVFQPFTNRVNFDWLNQFSFGEIQKRAAVFPPRTAILYALFAVDAKGVAYAREQALAGLHSVANAPIFGIQDSQMGRGIVGGPLMGIEELARKTAKVAVRILRGEPAGSIETPIQGLGKPVYDWREVKRWGISETRLPAGSLIRFRQPTFWELYRWPLAGTVSFCLLQAALIMGLLVNRAKRRHGEAVAALTADLSSRFINLPAGEVDLQIERAQRRIFELLGLDISGFWQWSAEASGFFRITHFSRGGEGPQPPEKMDSREWLPWFQQQVLAGRTIAVRSLKELPPEAARDRETFRQFGFKSNLTIPLSVGGGIPIGALGFTTRAEREWPEVVVKRLQLVAQIFANALARKHADQQLRESEERLITSLDAAGAGAWSVELKTRRVWASVSERKLFGLPADGPITIDSLMHVIHPDDRESVRTAVEDAIRTKARLFVEYRIPLPDGSVRWISARGHCRCGAKGEPDRLLGVSVDITERKRTEEALRQRGQYIETVLEQAPIGFAVHTIDDGVGRFVSARYEEIYGVRQGTIDSHHTFFDKVWPDHPELRADIRRRVVADMASGDSLRMRWEYVPVPLPSGEIRYITAMNIPVPDQNLIVSTVQDVTKEVWTEKALRESMERFRQVVESTGDLIWEVDAQGLYTYASPLVERMLGYTPEELVGKKHFYDLFDPAIREELKAAALRVFAERKAFRDFPNPNVSKSGKIVHLETSGVPMLDRAGNLVGYRGADTDVTKRKQSDKAMQELSGRLITAQEDERRRLARELHDDITQRLACLAIEAGRVERGVSDAALAAAMGEVREGLMRLSEDIHSLSYRLHPALLEDLGLIEALKAEGELFTRHESVPVKMKFRNVPVLVPHAAALCLFRVAQEALRNAGRHSRARKVELSLRGLDNGLQLAVRDDGCGFDPALNHDRPSLGLASMRERVRSLAGELDIESAPGHGTTIVAWVPMGKAEG